MNVKLKTSIVCLCGSTRFSDIMQVKQWEFTKAGYIVVSWCALPNWYSSEPHIGDREGVKEAIDELHKRKIDLCDSVYVIDVEGYIGESTRSEIAYAEQHGKPVTYLSKDDPEYVENLRKVYAAGQQQQDADTGGHLDDLAERILEITPENFMGRAPRKQAILDALTEAVAVREREYELVVVEEKAQCKRCRSVKDAENADLKAKLAASPKCPSWGHCTAKEFPFIGDAVVISEQGHKRLLAAAKVPAPYSESNPPKVNDFVRVAVPDLPVMFGIVKEEPRLFMGWACSVRCVPFGSLCCSLKVLTLLYRPEPMA